MRVFRVNSQNMGEDIVTDAPTPVITKTPWHLWVIGILALLWNAGGAFDFVATVTQFEPYMSNFTEEQLAYFYGFPAWQYVIWFVGTWGAFLGTIALLMRHRWAVPVFAASLVGALISFVVGMGVKNAPEGMGGIIFPVIIVTIATLLLAYAIWMRRRGVLR